MAISPLRIIRFPSQHLLADEYAWSATSSEKLSPEQNRNTYEHLSSALTRVSNALAKVDRDSGIFFYEQTVGGTTLAGVLAKLDLKTLDSARLKIPLPPNPVLAERAENHLQTFSMQLSPVVALYDADPSAISLVTGESVGFSLADGESCIAKLTSASAARFCEIVSDLVLTVIGGQEWLAPGRKNLAVLLVNRRSCRPELCAVHRVITAGPDFRAGEMVRLGRDHFFFRDVTRLMPRRQGRAHFDPVLARELLRPQSRGEIVMLAISARHSFRIHSLPGWADTVLAHIPPELRRLDSVQLHEILMPKAFGFDGMRPTPRASVGYTVSMEEAVSRVEQGASVAILMNTPSVDDICELPVGAHLPPEAFALSQPPLPGAFAYELA